MSPENTLLKHPDEDLNQALSLCEGGDLEAFFTKLTLDRVLDDIKSQYELADFITHLEETGKLEGMIALVRYLLPQVPHILDRDGQCRAIYMLDEAAPETSRVLGEGAAATELVREGNHFRFSGKPGLSEGDVNALVDDGLLPEGCRILDPYEHYDDLLKDI